MRLEIPECRRCCCCFPLRYGILIFGYLNLVFSILIVVLDIIIAVKGESSHRVMMIRGVQFYSHVWCGTALYVLEGIFSIVLVLGAHLKNIKLLRTYYYYGVTTTLASLVTLVVLNSANGCPLCLSTYFLISISFVVCSVGIQVYLLMLVRSELLKIRKNSRLCYVNHASEVVVEAQQTGHNPF